MAIRRTRNPAGKARKQGGKAENTRKKPLRSKSDKAGKKPSSTHFPVVGVGASAGGLEALERFLSHMPVDTGMAFVLVTHLAPSHVSMLPELLKRQTKMEVVQAEDGMTVQGNRIHIIPPNTDMAIINGALLLTSPTEARGLRLPVDHFFRSLAEDQRDRAICVILSGNGTDGTLGLKAVKAELGMAMVQEPKTAKYDGMPRSAIDTGLVDYILPPEKMPEQLIKYVHHYRRGAKIPSAADRFPGVLQKIFLLLRSQTGHDFSQYKKNTIFRRIERRMNVHQIENINDYLPYLQKTPQEAESLFKELLIGVTSFFRDPGAFKALKEHLLKMLAEKPKEAIIRAWVPGCSGGEEVYSLAILLKECMDELNRSLKVQVFGTDLDNEAIQTARGGVYPASIAADVSPERLKRHFVKEENTYRISKGIREMAVFAFQNVTKDPPFTKLDLLSCRNLLIYLETDLQKRLLPMFHYALRPDGLLFLGSSESVGGFVDLFALVDKKWRIFKRKYGSLADQGVVAFPSEITTAGSPEAGTETRKDSEVKIVALAEQLLLERYAPPCVLVSSEGNILYTHGRTGKFLELAPGQARLNVIEMAREGLKHELAAAIRKASTSETGLLLEGLQVRTNGGFQRANVSIKPVRRAITGEPLVMILFEDVEHPKPPSQKPHGRAKDDLRVASLEQDLKSTQQSLQATIEELETSNEELKSTNEELQSTNEEFQSTNEELETSKEELQSLNEELVTVNTELQVKIDELSLASSDMKNLLDSTKIATIFLDSQLHLKRFTPEAKRIINLIPSDVGRPIGDIVLNLEDVNLVQDAQKVLDTLVLKETEVRSKEGQYFLMRTMPYRTSERLIDGVVMTFTNLTDRKHLENRLRKSSLEYEQMFEALPVPCWICDLDTLHFLSANPAAFAIYQYSREEFMALSLNDLAQGKDALEVARNWNKLKKRSPDGSASFAWQQRRRDGTLFAARVTWRVAMFSGKQAILGVTQPLSQQGSPEA